MIKVAVGCDHRGLDYKKRVLEIITESGNQADDLGAFSTDSVDYPDIAKTVGEAVVAQRDDLGILICGTGIGMSIAANKVTGIRAALCCDAFMAGRARSHNDANILCLGAERGPAGVEDIIKTFLSTPFEGGRHQTRVDKMCRMDDEC